MRNEKCYMAIVEKSWRTRQSMHWMIQELLHYLDDHHQTVKVIDLHKLPGWIRWSSLLINFYLLKQLILLKRSTVFVEAGFLKKIGLLINVIKKIRAHQIIIIGSLGGPGMPGDNNIKSDWMQARGLRASDFCFVDSEDARQWLVNNQIDHKRIISLHDLDDHDLRVHTLNWLEHPLSVKFVRKQARRQLTVFFDRIS